MMRHYDVRRIDLNKLNSLTKYPSILTYHAMGERGRLKDEVQINFDGKLAAYEKVDGTNARMICGPDMSVIVGSREDLLWEREDLIGNPAMNIIATLRERVSLQYINLCPKNDTLIVYYGEVYGKGIGSNAKQYGKGELTGFRLFDIVQIPDYRSLLELPPDQISAWREGGGQSYMPAHRVTEIAAYYGWHSVPSVWEGDSSEMPRSIDDTYAWLKEKMPKTLCCLDDQGEGTPEGVVVRTLDRKQIAKIRFEDYRRTKSR